MPKGHEKEQSKTSPNNSPESIKEKQDVSNILVILDSHVIKTNPFGANVTGENSYRRAERICAALHLITNHVPEGEPLRTVIRKGGLELLAHILELRSGFRTLSSEKGQAALAAIRELVSLVRLLAVSGYVSAQNANVVSEALDELGSLIIVSQRSTLAEQLTISREDLTPPAQQSTSWTEPMHARIRQTKRERPIKDKKDTRAADTSVTGSARGEQIMDILRAGGVLGIKDISANLPQYSEKMIQRELADLVDGHKVKKVGEKRWSRYQIVQ